jgi:superfamily II DNA or RNA helicase
MPTVKVTVEARLKVDTRDLTDEQVDALKLRFTHDNPQWWKKRALKLPTYDEPKTIRTWRGAPGALLLPRGGTQALREELAKLGLAPHWSDKRTLPNEDPAFPRHNVQLYDYQELMVQAALKKTNCLLRSPTGSGKTTTAMALIARAAVPALVIVWNSALLDQWLERCTREFNLRERDIGIIQGGKQRLKPITLAMQQTLAKVKDEDRAFIQSYFGTVVCDEVHRFGAKTFMEVIDWMPAHYRIGMSADETRKDKKDFLIYDMFGGVAMQVDKRMLVDRNFTVNVQVRGVDTGSQVSWYRGQNDPQAFTKLLDMLAADASRDAQIADLVTREVQAGHQVLVFSHRREHCTRLSAQLAIRGVKAGVMLGGDQDSAELDRCIKGLKAGTLRAAVGTIQAVGTGIDIPTISRGVLATPIVSNKQLFGQVIGRLCRSAPGKSDALLYYMHDEQAFGNYPIRNLRKWVDVVTWELMGGAIIGVDERLRQADHGGQLASLDDLLNA